jgi:rubredoxin
MQQSTTIIINFKGGIISPGYLKDILDIASELRIPHVRFGLRQQMMLDVSNDKLSYFEKCCSQKNIGFIKGKNTTPNIVSSYNAADIFTTDSWLKEGVYKDVFDLFSFQPKLKINICDGKQSFTPLFSGHLNFIASTHNHFWYLYIRFPSTSIMYCWPEIIYTNDIAGIALLIEQLILSGKNLLADDMPDGEKLYHLFKEQNFSSASKPVEEPLIVPEFYLPYYEGFNKLNNTYWLGIYRRDELYPVPFLREVCSICLNTKIGQFYTTSWKTIIIKGIEAANRKLFDFVLGKYRINVRHAANELNWQVEDNNEDGLILKRHIIRYFDKEDVRTYGLSFAIKTKPSSSMFGSVIIVKQQNKNPNRLKSLERFSIFYTKDFNPNTDELILYRDNVEKDHIGTYLVSLCKLFYEQESVVHEKTLQESFKPLMPSDSVSEVTVFQCKHCLTVYDERLGDTSQNIAPGTLFADLPATYTCSLCDARKEDFEEIKETQLQLLG